MRILLYIFLLLIGTVWCFEIPSNMQNEGYKLQHKPLKTSGPKLKDTKCTQLYSCLNCTTARVCAPDTNGNLVEINRFNCSGSAPFCNPNTGTCTSTFDYQCDSTEDDFTCLKDGYFPDTTTCYLFHHCDNSTVYTYNCSQYGSNYYYDPNSNTCSSSYYSYCPVFNCNGYNGQKVRHPSNGKYFAYCVANKAFVVDRCDGNYQLNSTSQACEPICNNEGLIQDIYDSYSYYECKYINYQYVRTHKKCPQGSSFVPFEFQCVF